MLTRYRRSFYPPAASGLLSTIDMSSILHYFRRHSSTAEQVLTVELEREVDGRYIAEIPDMPGVMTYGATEGEAIQKVAALAFRVFADQLESDEVQARREMTFHLQTRECLAGR